MELAELERLIELVQTANIGELTIRQGTARVTIRKASRSSRETSNALVPRTPEHFDETEFLVTDDDMDAEDEAQDEFDPMLLITAPLVGVFGHVKPLVGLGARVKEGQVVGIIEAMKLVSDIKSPADGVVTNVLVEDGLPVEFGQALFEIRLAT